MPKRIKIGTIGGSRPPLPRLNAAEILYRDSPPDGLSWRDHLVELLRIAASIEHALMVQYLFAAYSLDPAKGREGTDQPLVIARWQNLLLSVAKEEMGHMLTVQNVLCLLGAPAELGRDDHSGSDFSPFPFKLERLTMDSLDRYTIAEMPSETPVPGSFWEKLLNRLSENRLSHYTPLPQDSGVTHVGILYQKIIELIDDPKRIPDTDFREGSYRFQACWDDWGRGHNYKTATHDGMNFISVLRSIGTQGLEPRRTNVIIERVAGRSQAKGVLIRISEQGEATPTASKGSHFQRFLSIRTDFEDLKKANGPDWEPTHRVVDNPHTLTPNKKRSINKSTITCPRSKNWADLFDLRYRMLLTYLGHYFHIASDGSEAPLRGLIVHKVFAEMYNLKAIAGLLVRLPVKDGQAGIAARDSSTGDCAAPPFQMPETLALPQHAADRWRLHGELAQRALELNKALNPEDCCHPEDELSYLRSLHRLDMDSISWIERVTAGLDTTGLVHHGN